MRSRKTKNVILVGALALAMGVTTLFSGVGESYAASDLKLNKTSRNILTRRSYDFDVVGASKDAVITWKSSDEKVATVDEDGVVTGITKGEAKITCTVKDGGKTVKLTATAKIRKPSVKIVIKNKIDELKVGKKYDLNRKLTPSTSNDVTTWTTSDKSIATVDKNGVVKAKKNGTVTITATTLSGKTDSVEIKVYGGKATATPKPTSKPKATTAPKATSAPKATDVPKATATPKPQATANLTYKFTDLKDISNWGLSYKASGSALAIDFGDQWSEVHLQFPQPVDLSTYTKAVITFATGSADADKDAICFKFAPVNAEKNEYGNPTPLTESGAVVTNGKETIEVALDGFAGKKLDEISVMTMIGNSSATVYEITFMK